MLVRTSVLTACMIVVPGLALCSHHLPAEIRAAARNAVWQPMVAGLQGCFTAPAAAESPRPDTPPVPRAEAAAEPDDRVVAGDSERLAALGAVAVECRPLESSGGVHVASCRVAMDAGGQLHRVFQAPGPSPSAATAALVQQVEAWRGRLAARDPGQGDR